MCHPAQYNFIFLLLQSITPKLLIGVHTSKQGFNTNVKHHTTAVLTGLWEM